MPNENFKTMFYRIKCVRKFCSYTVINFKSTPVLKISALKLGTCVFFFGVLFNAHSIITSPLYVRGCSRQFFLFHPGIFKNLNYCNIIKSVLLIKRAF